MRIASFNVNSLRVRLGILTDWLAEAQPDVVCLQELKLTEDKFPADKLRDAGYEHQIVLGQKTYNGVAMLSKTPIEDPHTGFRIGPADKQARLVQGTVNGVRILGCYAPNGTKLATDKFAYKLAWYARLMRELSAGGCTPDSDIVVCGDMNIAHGESDVFNAAESHGKLHFHPVERDLFSRLLDWGLVDTFRHHHPKETSFTWWDYRQDAFNRGVGLRIDYMLATQSVNERVSAVKHWRELRALDKPSDHAPVTLDLSA